MNLDPSRLEITPLEESKLADVIRMVELLEETPHWPLDSYLELLTSKSSVLRISLVARDTRADEGIGFATARLIPPEAELEFIGVTREFQRHGVGSRLFSALASELRLQGVEELHLEVRASNLSAIGFYRSLGFVRTGTRPRYYTDPMEDAVLMTLRI